MLNLPLALTNRVAGVFLAGGLRGMTSTMGSMTLFRMATRNGIRLVSHIQYLIQREAVTKAVERAAHERLVLIVMTAMPLACLDPARVSRG
jgi:Cu/Ag efflux pump CusA